MLAVIDFTSVSTSALEQISAAIPSVLSVLAAFVSAYIAVRMFIKATDSDAHRAGDSGETRDHIRHLQQQGYRVDEIDNMRAHGLLAGQENHDSECDCGATLRGDCPFCDGASYDRVETQQEFDFSGFSAKPYDGPQRF